MAPHTNIRKLRDCCGQLFSQMYQQTEHGYLGQVEIVCRMPTNVYMIEIQGFPISHIEISGDEANQWHPGRASRLSKTPISGAKLIDLCEKIMFTIYQDSGYGSLNLKFWHLEQEQKYKVLLRWSVTHQQPEFLLKNTLPLTAFHLTSYS